MPAIICLTNLLKAGTIYVYGVRTLLRLQALLDTCHIMYYNIFKKGSVLYDTV